MKKTIIALLALGGVAAADVTIGSYFTKDGVNYDSHLVISYVKKTKSQYITSIV